MAQGLPNTRFNSAALVRALAELAVADAVEPRQSFAERLGAWLDFKDALALYPALNSGAAAATTALVTASPAANAAALRAELVRMRSGLAESIAAADEAARGGADPAAVWPEALAEAAADALADPAAPNFLPLHRYYLARQRSLAGGIAPLRARARAEMARRSAVLKQLATLDAVMEQALAAREAGLLAQVPVLLGKRFARLSEAHGARPGAESAGRGEGKSGAETSGGAGQDDGSGRWMQPDGWLARFCAEMQHVLLAELDLRLMPVAGLVAALDTESTERE
ncbi:DUF3348 family protein [Thauera butanivorans]|uniref:DUF3348 family protein n=1 Tax=Thauera butanivorans TaxID=86174 RepID=UPI0008387CF8|nr:DUF3348 family protein [Thauera butanivorans]